MLTGTVTISLPQGLTIGGVTTWALHLAEGLADAGRRVNLVAHVPYEPCLAPVEAPRHANLCVIRAPCMYDTSGWRASLGIYRELLPTILLPNLSGESYAVAATLALAVPEQIRIVGWNHSDNPHEHALLGYHAPMVHRFAAVSRRCDQELERRLPGRTRDVTHLPYGVPIPDPVRRAPIVNRPVRLLYTGRIDQPVKRVFDLIELARRLLDRGVPFELRFLGDGPQAADLRMLIADLAPALGRANGSLVHHPAVQPNAVHEHCCWADAVLLASCFEGLSLSMLEAMAAGCIPIVSAVDSGVGDVIREAHNGLTFPIGDVDALADRVQWLVRHPDDAPRLSAEARRVAAQHAGMPAFLENARALLDAAANDAPRPWPPELPVRMGGATVQDPTVPADAPQRMRAALEQLARDGHTRVALYCTGNHTRKLAAQLADPPLEIVAMVDDDPARHGHTLWGWPTVSADETARLGVDAVVISSWMHQERVWRARRERFAAAGIRLVRLYPADVNPGQTAPQSVAAP